MEAIKMTFYCRKIIIGGCILIILLHLSRLLWRLLLYSVRHLRKEGFFSQDLASFVLPKFEVIGDFNFTNILWEHSTNSPIILQN